MSEPTPDDLKYKTYWATRDSRSDGGLSELIDVWHVRPSRHPLPGGGAMWLGPGDTGVEHRYQVWPLAVARKEIGNGMPETDMECVMVGAEV